MGVDFNTVIICFAGSVYVHTVHLKFILGTGRPWSVLMER